MFGWHHVLLFCLAIVAHDIFIEPVLLVGRLFARFVILLGCVAHYDLGGVKLICDRFKLG